MRIAVLDDYQQVALAMADWSVLDADIEVFSDHVADPDALVRRLAPYDVVVLMRERTPLPAEVIDALPALRLVVTTGRRNAAVDLEAAPRTGHHRLRHRQPGQRPGPRRGGRGAVRRPGHPARGVRRRHGPPRAGGGH